MKRSEMVNLFVDYLSANYDETWNDKKDHVSAILSFLEVSGMSPPRHKLKATCGCSEGCYDCTDDSWESENAK